MKAWTEIVLCRWCYQPVPAGGAVECEGCWKLFTLLRRRASLAARMLVEIAREEERQDGR